MTPYLTCESCDPLGDGSKGCPPGLRCGLHAGEVGQCDCLDENGSARDGESCTGAYDCAYGFFCVDDPNGGLGKCRPMCRVDRPLCAAGTVCKEPPNTKIYGYCESL